MKSTTAAMAALALATILPAPYATANSVVFEIGTFNNGDGGSPSASEFEQESGLYNDPSFFYEPGDYSETRGRAGNGYEWPGPEGEILQDPPDENGNGWGNSVDGFPRAVVPGRPVIDIFFQLTPEEAASEALLLETTLFGLGENSLHNLAFFFNGVAFHYEGGVAADKPLSIYIPRNFPGMIFEEGANVLSVERLSGGKVDTAEGTPDNPWIQFDAFRLTAGMTAPNNLIFQAGWFDHSLAEMETEGNDYNDPRYYAAVGDYTAVQGVSGFGINWVGPGPEIWQDGTAPDTWGLSLEEGNFGLPRAVSFGRNTVDYFFQLTQNQSQEDYLSFNTRLIHLAGNSFHNIEIYMNGTMIESLQNVNRDTDVEVIIPRQGVRAAQVGPVFNNGSNVLSITRTGGGAIDPDLESGHWIQIDAVSLSTLSETPENPASIPAWHTPANIGFYNYSTSEFEVEWRNRVNTQYYAAAGDYTNVEGQAGYGEVWAGPGAEIWQDGPLDEDWIRTLDGFPRALTNGDPIIDIYFDIPSTVLPAEKLVFTTLLFAQGADSSHDVEFYLNGQPFHTQLEITSDTYIQNSIPLTGDEFALNPGGNVLSLKRIGGLDSNPWIQIDRVSFSVLSNATAVPPVSGDFAITSITRAANGDVALTWESTQGASYTVESSATLAQGSWASVGNNVTGQSGTTSYTHTGIPAATTTLFYRVVRN